MSRELSSTILVALSHAFRNLATTLNGDERSHAQDKSASSIDLVSPAWCRALQVHHPLGSNRYPVSINFVRPCRRLARFGAAAGI